MIPQRRQPRNPRHRAASGFTLIELLLVMVIIAIMAGVVIYNTAGQSEKARVSTAKEQLSHIKTALAAFEIENGHFPSSDEGLSALVGAAGTKRYLDTDKPPMDPWGRPFIYHLVDNGSGEQTPVYYSTGPSGTDQQGNGDNVKLN